MTNLIVLVGFLVFVLAVVLIPQAIIEAKDNKNSTEEYNEFYPVEYK